MESPQGAAQGSCFASPALSNSAPVSPRTFTIGTGMMVPASTTALDAMMAMNEKMECRTTGIVPTRILQEVAAAKENLHFIQAESQLPDHNVVSNIQAWKDKVVQRKMEWMHAEERQGVMTAIDQGMTVDTLLQPRDLSQLEQEVAEGKRQVEEARDKNRVLKAKIVATFDPLANAWEDVVQKADEYESLYDPQSDKRRAEEASSRRKEGSNRPHLYGFSEPALLEVLHVDPTAAAKVLENQRRVNGEAAVRAQRLTDTITAMEMQLKALEQKEAELKSVLPPAGLGEVEAAAQRADKLASRQQQLEAAVKAQVAVNGATVLPATPLTGDRVVYSFSTIWSKEDVKLSFVVRGSSFTSLRVDLLPSPAPSGLARRVESWVQRAERSQDLDRLISSITYYVDGRSI